MTPWTASSNSVSVGIAFQQEAEHGLVEGVRLLDIAEMIAALDHREARALDPVAQGADRGDRGAGILLAGNAKHRQAQLLELGSRNVHALDRKRGADIAGGLGRANEIGDPTRGERCRGAELRREPAAERALDLAFDAVLRNRGGAVVPHLLLVGIRFAGPGAA